MSISAVGQIIADLQGIDLARQVDALEKFFLLPTVSVSESDRQAVLTVAVNALEKSTNPYPIAERLLRFREEAVPPVADLLARNPSQEVKTLAALILINNGSRLGVPALVEEVDRGGDYLVTASLALANAGVIDHASTIIERLRRCSVPPLREFPTAEDDVVLALITVLRKLRVPLPEDIRRKFCDPQAPWFFRSAVEQHNVDGSPA